jgi:transcriptional regulator with XRE-family HTH domain
MHTLGAVVRSSRREKGLTLRALAALVEVSATYIHQIERGERIPSEGAARALAKVLDLDVDRLSLLAGSVPADVLAALRAHPELLTRIRTLSR